jgi:hypothetical protein
MSCVVLRVVYSCSRRFILFWLRGEEKPESGKGKVRSTHRKRMHVDCPIKETSIFAPLPLSLPPFPPLPFSGAYHVYILLLGGRCVREILEKRASQRVSPPTPSSPPHTRAPASSALTSSCWRDFLRPPPSSWPPVRRE